MATDFLYQAKQLMRRNREGSFATQSNRVEHIKLIDKQLQNMGFRKLQLKNIKYKHVEALLKQWKEQGLAVGTIKNRLTTVRWLCEKVGKKGMCPNSNAAMGIERRQYVTNQNRSRELTDGQLAKLNDHNLVVSFKLQREFGLRKEESMKIHPKRADKGDTLEIVKSKGGRPRVVPIITTSQREVLEEAIQVAQGGSLIPNDLTYVQQMKRYERACIRMGLDKAHGLRHAYAQARYKALTGHDAPAVTGKSTKNLVGEEKLRDRNARMVISQELGHGREDVTAVYLGR